MNAIRVIPVLIALASSLSVSAQEVDHRLGEHPAIIAKRLAQKQTYDYAAKFYPHPAWLYFSAEAPRPMVQHPAVIVAERERQRLAAEAAERDARPVIAASRH